MEQKYEADLGEKGAHVPNLYERKIQEAIGIVKDIPPTFQLKAFEVVLSKMLRNKLVDSQHTLNKCSFEKKGSSLSLEPKSVARSSLSQEIDKIVDRGFFDTPQPISKLVGELQSRGFFNKRESVDAYVRKILLNKTLLRIKQGRTWAYVNKK